MYSCVDAHGSALPRATRYLSRQVLCGLCGFGCCQMPSGGCECTEVESNELGVPREWRHKCGPDKARCFCLTNTGCKFGSRRPVLCKLYPLQYKDGKLLVNFWSIMHCPTPKCFEFVEMVGDSYVYVRKSVVATSLRYNCKESIVLKHKLEDFPTVLDTCREALEMLWGGGTVEELKKQLVQLTRKPLSLF